MKWLYVGVTEGVSHLSRAIRHTGESVGARDSSQTQLVNAKSTLLSHKRMVAKPCVFICGRHG